MCVGRSGRVMFCSALVLWVVLLLGIATGLPVLPLMIAGLVVTAVVAALRYADHRAARG